MMQSCASAAKLRSGGPILPFGMKAKGRLGIPSPRTVIGVPSQAYGQGRNCGVPSASSVHYTARKTTPSGTMPSRTSRHRAISSLRGRGYRLDDLDAIVAAIRRGERLAPSARAHPVGSKN